MWDLFSYKNIWHYKTHLEIYTPLGTIEIYLFLAFKLQLVWPKWGRKKKIKSSCKLVTLKRVQWWRERKLCKQKALNQASPGFFFVCLRCGWKWSIEQKVLSVNKREEQWHTKVSDWICRNEKKKPFVWLQHESTCKANHLTGTWQDCIHPSGCQSAKIFVHATKLPGLMLSESFSCHVGINVFCQNLINRHYHYF